MIAPARLSRATAGASADGTCSANNLVPPVVRKSRVAIVSLIVIGKPQSGGTSAPRMFVCSAARAASKASGANVTMAFRLGFNSSARRKYAAHASTGETSCARMSASSCTAVNDVNSAVSCSLPLCLFLVRLRQQFDKLARGCAERAVAAIDEADGACPFGFRKRDDGELPAPLFINDARTRHNCDAEADFDRAFDRLDIVELGHLMHADAVRAQDAVGRLARRDVALKEDEVQSIKFARAHLLLPGERMFGRADEHK